MQLEGKEIIRKVEGACLAGRLPWMSEGQSPVLQPIRANVSHFKKPWFDSVEVRRLGPRGEEETAYAELRLLFEADVSTAGKVIDPTSQMFARFHYSFPNTQPLILFLYSQEAYIPRLSMPLFAGSSMHQFVVICWRQRVVSVLFTTQLLARAHKVCFKVIHLSSIVCRHHVVPSFRDKNSFYVSCFSPVRPV